MLVKNNAFEIGRLSDYMARVKGELKLVSKYASMVATQAEQVHKDQDDLLDELNNKPDFAIRVATRTGRMTQEPLYPEVHPKRIELDSQRNNVDAPSPSKKKKKKNDRTLHASSEPIPAHLRIPMIFLFLMLKHNLVMNMNLVIIWIDLKVNSNSLENMLLWLLLKLSKYIKLKMICLMN